LLRTPSALPSPSLITTRPTLGLERLTAAACKGASTLITISRLDVVEFSRSIRIATSGKWETGKGPLHCPVHSSKGALATSSTDEVGPFGCTGAAGMSDARPDIDRPSHFS